MRAIISTILVAAIVPTAASGTGAAERARPGGPPTFAQLRWAREELDAVLGSAVPVRVVGSSGSNGSSESLTCGVSLWRETLAHPRVTLLQLPGAAPLESRGDAPPQSFSLRCAAHAGCTRCVVVGADGAGLMYGVSRLLDEARVGAAVVDRNGSGRLRLLPQLPSEPVAVDQGAPYIIFRGLKLNAPIDARTPSYADCGDSAQANMATMWCVRTLGVCEGGQSPQVGLSIAVPVPLRAWTRLRGQRGRDCEPSAATCLSTPHPAQGPLVLAGVLRGHGAHAL